MFKFSEMNLFRKIGDTVMIINNNNYVNNEDNRNSIINIIIIKIIIMIVIIKNDRNNSRGKLGLSLKKKKKGNVEYLNSRQRCENRITNKR